LPNWGYQSLVEGTITAISYKVLTCWTVGFADQPIIHCSDGLRDDGHCKYVMYPRYEVGSYEEGDSRLLCQNSPGMRQLEKGEASHGVAYDFTSRGDQAA
jgi:hypothetical protein